MKKNYDLFCIIFILLICSCSKVEIKAIKSIGLEKIAEIKSTSAEDLNAISRFACAKEDRIYIYDNTTKKMFVFNKNGEFLDSFGDGGKGPGEFIFVSGIAPDEHEIKIIDIGKSSIIRYDYNNNFISENIFPLCDIQFPVVYKKRIISWYNKIEMKNDKGIRKKGLVVFSDSLRLINEIYTKEVPYEPYTIDSNELVPVFSVNKKTGDIAIPEIDSKKFKIFIFDKDYKKKNEIYLDLAPINYSKKERKRLSDYYSHLKKSLSERYGKNFKLLNLDKRKRLVLSLSYDIDSNLWILVPCRNNKKRIYLFDKTYKLKGYFHVPKEISKIYIVENTFFNAYGIEESDNTIEIYKIVKK